MFLTRWDVQMYMNRCPFFLNFLYGLINNYIFVELYLDIDKISECLININPDVFIVYKSVAYRNKLPENVIFYVHLNWRDVHHARSITLKTW